MTPEISVVIATYNRGAPLARLLGQLAKQTVGPRAFEVVVVDDGSKEPAANALRGLDLPYELRVERQKNAGAAAARHRGATLARGEILHFLDDDMQVPERLLAAHLAIHRRDPDAVVLGVIRQNPEHELTLFERFHVRTLERFADDVAAGRAQVRGPNLWTGNLSLRRARYHAVGGFDESLGHSEDAELGVRLEVSGAHFHLSAEGQSLHDSDHTSLDGWMRRAFKYGVFDTRIAKKHPEVAHADPWRYFRSLSRMSRPFLVGAIAAPGAAKVASRAAMAASLAIDRAGLERIALAGTTLAYGIEYARGMRDEAGGLLEAIEGYMTYAAKGPTREERSAAVTEFLSAVRADHAVIRHYRAKYAGEELRAEDLPKDAVQKIGFQIMIAYRAMRLFGRLGVPLAPKVMSRLIRHLYGSDIHWEAEFSPGVLVVHGMGLAINDAAKVEGGAILFQNVTLGAGTHPDTKAYGAPTIEKDVHIGPGATITGPVTIGARSKVMAGCVVRRSVPPDSLVTAPEPVVIPRRRAETAAAENGARRGE